MSRTDSNGRTQYTINEKIKYYQNKLNRKGLSATERLRCQVRLRELCALKSKYGVIYMEDERFFPNSGRDGHNYIISNIEADESIDAHIITHRKKGTKPLKGFDGRSRTYKKAFLQDKKGQRLNVGDAYTSIYSNQPLCQEDIDLIEGFKKKK